MGVNKYALLFSIVFVGGCASSQIYTAGSSKVLVLPSKGWYKVGVTGKEAYLVEKQCNAEAEEQPGYLEAKKISESVPDEVRWDMRRTKEDTRKMFAKNIFIGEYINSCMIDKGFKYMKYPAGEEVYTPPPPPTKGWVKSGVSYVQTTYIKGKCLDQEYSQKYLNKCMTEQGFIYRELTEDELPPCWHVGGMEPCKNEPSPSR